VIVLNSAAGANIRVFRGGLEIGNGTAPMVRLSITLQDSDTVKVVQQVPGCYGQTARNVEVMAPEVDL
jgi:hypothetical protein